MAHFARLDDDNKVIDLLVVDNATLDDLPFPESEPVGQEFLANFPSERTQGRWIQTSYNANFRGQLGQIGFVYDEEADEFVMPQGWTS